MSPAHPTAEERTSSEDVVLGRMVRNSIFNGLGVALIVPLNFLALFTLARRLGADSLGTFFTIFAISAVIHWIADAGTTTVLTRHVARARDNLREIVPEAIGVLVAVCAASAVLFFAVSIPWMMLHDGAVSGAVLVVAAAAMASRHALDFASNVFRGLERFEFENLARVVQTGLFLLFVWSGVYPETGAALAAFVAFAASNFIAALLIWAVLLWTERCAGFRLNREMLGRWLRESLPLGAGDVVRQVLLQLDTLLLAAFRPAAVVGLFSVAARPLQPLQLLPRIIVSVTFPHLSRAGRLDRAAVSRMFAQTTTLLVAAALPISIAISLCALPLILATAGPDFAAAAAPLQVLIWATALIFVNAQLRLVLTALDEERRYWRLISGVLGAKLLVGVVCIPLWGIYGACVASLAAEALLCIGAVRQLSRLGIEGPQWTQLVRLVLPAAAMAGVLWFITPVEASLVELAATCVASGLLYLVLCLAAGVWPRAELLRVRDVVRPRRRVAPLGALSRVASAEASESAAT